MSSSIKEILEPYTVRSPIFPNNFGTVIKVNEDATIPDTFRKLIDNRIMAVPIVSTSTGEVKGLVTIQDILNHLLKVFSDQELFKIFDAIRDKEELKKKKINEVQLDTFEDAIQVDQKTNLYDAAKMMVERKVHRLLVCNERKEVINLLTESRLLRLIAVSVDYLEKAKHTIQSLKLGSKPVICISTKAKVRDAFQKMLEERVSALGVIDESGVLVGNLSVNDIKIVGYDLNFFGFLATTVEDYLKEIRLTDSRRTVPDYKDPVCCQSYVTLEYVINTLGYYKIHRIYIVDGNRKPVGVISLHDVLQELLK